MLQSSIVERKADLRQEMIMRRRALEPGARRLDPVVGQLGRLDFGPPGTVAGYWPLRDELDPRPAMAHFERLGWSLALPRMQGRGRPLVFHRWAEGEPLQPGPFRVSEPLPESPVVVPDLILTPLLAFDRKGRRLGYGGGFYDRTFEDLRARGHEPLRLALAFAAQEASEVPSDPTDAGLDGVITGAEVLRFSPRMPA